MTIRGDDRISIPYTLDEGENVGIIEDPALALFPCSANLVHEEVAGDFRGEVEITVPGVPLCKCIGVKRQLIFGS